MALEHGFTKYLPAKIIETAGAGPREAKKSRERIGTRVESQTAEFDSPCAETLDVSPSLSKEQYDGVVAMSMPGVVPSSSAGAMPSRNP